MTKTAVQFGEVSEEEMELAPISRQSRYTPVIEALEQVEAGGALKVHCPEDIKIESFKSNLSSYIRRSGLASTYGLKYRIRSAAEPGVIYIQVTLAEDKPKPKAKKAPAKKASTKRRSR